MSKSFRYVKDFEFPSEAGYTGSCGKTMVKGYARGGNVTPTKPAAPANAHGMATSAAAHARNDARKAAKAAPTAPPPITRTPTASVAPTALKRGGKVMRKADGGNVTTNEAGQRLFVSTPAPAPIVTPAAPAPRRRKGRRDFGHSHNQKENSARQAKRMAEQQARIAQKAGATPATPSVGNPAVAPAIARKAGGSVRKSYPTNKSEPMVKAKVGKVMGEFKSGDLHSGSKSGPVVKSGKQAMAIALSEARASKKK